MKLFTVTIKKGSTITRRVQSADTARHAAKIVKAFYYQNDDDVQISARRI